MNGFHHSLARSRVFHYKEIPLKLATLKDGTRDGQLAVVSRGPETAHIADGIALTMRRALDEWSFIASQLRQLYEELNAGKTHRSFGIDPKRCMAAVPR